MNTENETPLEQWIEETKKKNLSLKDLENYIRKAITCPYDDVYFKLPGLDSQDKAEILFAEWNTQPKPIEKWSVGSYVVFLKNVGNTKAGYVDIITQKGDSVSVYLKKYLKLSISRESKGEIKWFATEAEAEEFAETLIPDKVKNKFTVGTWYKLNNWISKFHHLEEDYKFYGENINTYSGYLDPLGWLSLSEYTPIELSIEEVQQYLPKGHSDKILIPPERWCIKVTHENKDILSKWRTIECLSATSGYCLNKHVLFPNTIGYWVKEKPEDYTEITMEQFNKYVLIKEAEPMTIAEELIAEAKRRYSIGTKFIPAHVSQNPNYFCIVCTTDFRYENDCLYAVLPDNTIYDFKNNPEYGNCDLNRVIFYSKKWATILPTENKPQFEVGKWYQIKTAYNWIIKYKETNGNTIKAMWCCVAEPGNKVKKNGTWSTKPTKIKELSIEEVQQYLPDNHPDKIKPNQKFKVGDWVVWGDGYIDTIKRHCNSFTDSWYLSEKYNSCSELALRHATQDEINKHLISIGELMTDELLTPKYTIYGGVTYVGGSGIVEGPLKMILSIDDEELPMVDIIKTKSTQILNND